MSAKVEACEIAAGSVITFDFKEEEGTDGRAIENEHNGPITAYMAPAESQGQGAVWFKIFEQGYDMDSDMWAINILNENDGLIDITIPADIKAGDYILRGEILALHLADQGVFEVYCNCVHLTVTGGGDAVPEGIDLKEMYGDTDGNPGLLWDLYDGEKKEYPIPGPKVYEAGTAPAGGNNVNSPSKDVSSEKSSEKVTEEEEQDDDENDNKSDKKSRNGNGKSGNNSPSETEDDTGPTATSSSDEPALSASSIDPVNNNIKLQRPCNKVRKRRR
ncbi:hypothetical protein LPJ53_005622 [Coemansia erecta]|uniref:AA9 family lytic polysaccharide monooxygenase n=1 Tax=Coemansia erecta TaxID=147472 RepID=A0A9W7XS37_9FUNG|nr:hypothetical protein LPJ53_005622 [Coemansia erecta]